MSYKIGKQDINHEPFMGEPPNFSMKTAIMKTYMTYKCEIVNTIQLTDMEKLFHIRIIDPHERNLFSFQPGQFVMVDVPGYGEVPISISSAASNKEYIELCIRKAGKTTDILHKAMRGARIGIRGPFGSSFPMRTMVSGSILLIAGGLGLAPLRAPIFWVCDHRDNFRDVAIMYGTKDESQLLFTYQYEEWQKVYDIKMLTIVEKNKGSWKGKTGMITALFDDIVIDVKNTYAIVCGPPVMFKFVCHRLDMMGLPMNRMFVSLERRMHCGMGKCCRCMVGDTFTCVDGPVFDYWSVLNLKEAI